MTNYRKNGPVHLPTESVEEDVFEIDGDAVEFDGEITVIGAEADVVFVEPVAEAVVVIAETAPEPDAEIVTEPASDEVAASGVEGAAEVAPPVDDDWLEPGPVEAGAPAEAAAETEAARSSAEEPAECAEPGSDGAPSPLHRIGSLSDLDAETAQVLAGYLDEEAGFDDFLPPIPPPRYVAPRPPAADPSDAPAEPAADATPSKESEVAREAISELKTEVRLKSEMLSRMTDEKSELMDRLLRKQAEFENFRKRGEREMQEAYSRARADVVGDLLPVLDNLDLAIKHADGASADVFAEGVQLIYKQMVDTLGRIGLEPIDADGQPFDPELHEAVATETDETVPDHTVVGVLQRGFKLGDRLLRPARVKVAVQP